MLYTFYLLSPLGQSLSRGIKLAVRIVTKLEFEGHKLLNPVCFFTACAELQTNVMQIWYSELLMFHVCMVDCLSNI